MYRSNIKYFLFTIFFLCFYTCSISYGQEIENTFQSRMEVQLNYKPIKKLELSFTPEIRFTENFSPDKYLFEFGTEYKLTKWLIPEVKYRFEINKRENKPAEYHHRYALGLSGNTSLNDFTGSLRLRYTNDTDDDDDNAIGNKFLRYKVSLKYDIPNFKLTPYVATEAFQLLGGKNTLYKLRSELGGSYELMKNHYINASYKFDFYKTEYKNKHILSIGYKIKF